MDPIAGNADGLGQAILAEAKLGEEFVLQDFAGMG